MVYHGIIIVTWLFGFVLVSYDNFCNFYQIFDRVFTIFRIFTQCIDNSDSVLVTESIKLGLNWNRFYVFLFS